MTSVSDVAAPTILLATRSAGKRRELAALCTSLGVATCTLEEAGVPEDPVAEEAVECHATFAANARAKAEWFKARAAVPWVLAEDSGLCVDALGGAPGVQSKRWGGAATEQGAALDVANIARLQAALAAVQALTDDARAAAYVCDAVLLGPAGVVVTATGRTAGHILATPQGAGGFGYDPVFWSAELGASFGTVSAAQKASVSHRGRAIRCLLEAAQEFWRTR